MSHLDSSDPICPWSRLVARFIDILILGGAVNILALSVVLFASPKAYMVLGSFLDVYSSVLMITFCFGVTLVEPFFLSFMGYTPGKFLLNIKVRDQNQNRLSLLMAIKRSGLVFAQGLGFGLPVISAVMVFLCYHKLKKTGTTSYDQKLKVKVLWQKLGMWRYAAISFFVIILCLANFYLVLFSTHTENWRDYVAPDNLFQIRFPVEPVITVKDQQKGELKVNITGYSAYYNMYEGGYVSVRKYSQTINQSRFEQLAQIILKNMIAEKPYHILEQGMTEFKDYPAFEFKIFDPHSGLTNWGRFILSNDDTVFLVMASYLSEGQKFKDMMTSFEIFD